MHCKTVKGAQKGGERAADIFIEMRNRCKIHLPETVHVKMIQSELDIELTKKFKTWSSATSMSLLLR